MGGGFLATAPSFILLMRRLTVSVTFQLVLESLICYNPWSWGQRRPCRRVGGLSGTVLVHRLLPRLPMFVFHLR